jgi:hypothetical protein
MACQRSCRGEEITSQVAQLSHGGLPTGETL